MYSFLEHTNEIVQRVSDGAFIPLHKGNRDCVNFLISWKAGATVTNADGSPAPYSDAAVIALGLEPPADPTPLEPA